MSELKENTKPIQSIAPITNNVTKLNYKIIEESKLNPEAEEFKLDSNKVETEINAYHASLKPVPLMYLNMEIVGKQLKVKTLLDSGTSVSTICNRFLMTHGISYNKEITKQLSGIGKENSEKVLGNVTLQLRSHSKIFKTTNFIVVEGKNIDCDVILGRKFCVDNALIVDPKNKLLSQTKNNEVLWSVIIDDENVEWPICHTMTCLADKNQTIKRQQMTEVSIKYENETLCECQKCTNSQTIPWYYNGEVSDQLKSIQGYDGLMNKKTKTICASVPVQ